MKILLERLSLFIERKWYLIIVIHLILFSFFLINIEKVKVEGNFEKLIPSDSKAIKNINLLRNKFDTGDSFLIIVHIKREDYERGYVTDIRDERVLNYIRELTEKLRKERFVSNVVSVTDRNTTSLENYVGEFFDSSFSYTLIKVDTYVGARDVDVENFVERIEHIIENVPKPEGIDVDFAGVVILRYEFFSFIKSDLVKITLLTLIIVFFALLLVTRNFIISVLIYISIIFSTVYILGFLGFLGEKINIVTMILVPLIIGLTIDYNIQIAYRIVEEFYKGKGLRNAIVETGRAIIFSSLTTLSAFVSMLIAAIPGLKSLGLIGLIGISFSLILALTFLPSIFIPFRDKVSNIKLFKHEMYKEYKLKYTRIIIILTIVITIVFAYGAIFKFKVETSTEKAFPQNLPFVIWTNKIRDEIGKVDNIILILKVDGEKYKDIRNKEILRYISFLERSLKEMDYVRNVYSIVDIVKDFERYSQEELNDMLKNVPLIDKTCSLTIMILDVITGTELEKISKFVNQLKLLLDRYKFDGIQIDITGSTYLGYELREHVIRDFSKITFMTTILVLILLWLNFKSFRRILISIIPLGISMIITFGLLGFVGFSLRPEATSLASILIGLGIDYSIITYNRFLEERKSYSFLLSRKPIISSALITVITFSSILSSKLLGIKQLGVSLMLGIGICAIVIILLLPHLIKIVEKITY